MKLAIDLFAPLQAQYERLRIQTSRLDRRLATRYGDRYTNIKDQLDNTRNWYEKTKSEAKVSGTLPLEEQQIAARRRSAEAGVGAARREQAIKQKLRKLWHTIRIS